jgi:maleate isomerase
MPNDIATSPSWTEMPVRLDAEPAVCVGLVALANDGTMEGDLHAFLRDGDLRICTTRVYAPRRNTLATLTQLQDRLAAAMTALVPEDRLDIAVFGCTSGAMALGSETVRAALTQGRPALKVTDPVSAALRALGRLNCRRVALLTPYIGEVNAMVGQFLTANGLELRATGYFPLVDDNGRARVTESSFLVAALQLTADPAVEALFVSCTALRTAGLVDRLEAAIGRPVVTSNQAVAWDVLRQCGDGRSIPGAGRLLDLV